jgi:dienelactone hydrolase
MTGGFAVTKEPGTDLFAGRFNDAGFAVLAFDYRCFGESGGRPRQVARIRDQLADWQAAIACAASLPGVDPAKLAIWSFSASGGHVLRVAARNPRLAAAIAQTPNADGPAAAPRVRCPLLVVVCDQDQSALAEPAARAARRAPHGELVRLPGGHYAPFLGAHERAVQAELSFLRQNLLEA